MVAKAAARHGVERGAEHHAGGAAVPREAWIRITSYNVCYTKLLRGDQPRVVCQGHAAEVTAVFASRSAPLVATNSWDETTRLWDVETGRELRRMSGKAEAGEKARRRHTGILDPFPNRAAALEAFSTAG